MFSGFTQETADFLWGLSFNNERPWFLEHKEQYERCLAAPFKLLAEETTELMRQSFPQRDFQLHSTRIYRDARRLFGRGPYKESLWFSLLGGSSRCETLGFWFEVSAASYSFGVGSFSSTPAEMEAFRTGIDANPARFERIAKYFAARPEYSCYAEEYKRPKGDKGELLNRWYNRKNVGVICTRDFGGVLLTPELPKFLAEEFTKLMPLYDYLYETFNSLAAKSEEGKG